MSRLLCGRPRTLRSEPVSRAEALAIGVFLGLYLMLLLYSLRFVGITWDEPKYLIVGRANLLALSNLSIEAFTNDPWTNFRGPLVPTLGALTQHLFHHKLGWVNYYEGFHVVVCFFSVLCLLCIYLLVRLAFGTRTGGVAAMCFLAFHPVFFVHSLANIKDIPLSAFFALAAVCCVAGAWSTHRLLKAVGVFVGACALMSKLNAAFIPVILGSSWVVVWVLDFVYDREGFRMRLRSRLVDGAVVAGGLVCGLLLVQAWYWRRPIWQSIGLSYRGATALSLPAVPFFGRIYQNSHAVPASFYAVYSFLSVLSPILIPLVAYGYVTSLLMLARSRRQVSRRFDLKVRLVLVVWITAVFGRYLVLDISIYDGMRHVMSTLVPVAILTGIEAERLAKRWRHPTLILSVAGLCAAYPFLSHYPYTNTYYNFLARLPPGPLDKNVDIEYWGFSVRRGVEWIREHRPGTSVYFFLSHDTRWFYFPEHDGVPIEEADIVLVPNRKSWVDRSPDLRYLRDHYALIHEYRFRGKVLYRIYERSAS